MIIARLRTHFSSTFWVANGLELFERLAFYASKAVLAKYIADRVGLTEDAGALTGLFSGLIFFLPIVAGVFVDRYGFRKTLVACFLIFCLGYCMIGLAGLAIAQPLIQSVGKYNYMLVVLVLTAIGGSLIKPCIVGTVSNTTTPETRALGFSIYYSLVNLGGAIGPIFALLVREKIGIEYVLIMSSIVSFMLCIGTLLFFREPEAVVAEKRSFSRVFSDMMMVFTNVRFMLFLIIFSGFWLMFWQIYFLVPFFGTDVLGFNQFELLETVDAIAIIVLTIPVTALVRRWKPMHAVTAGLLMSSFCWVIMGSFLTVHATIAAIVLFAVGESTQAPRFYEYVSKLAPSGQVGTFMGFAFLPVALGAFGAGYLSDWLRINFMKSNPSLMWYIVAAIGIVSTLLMIMYNTLLAPAQAEQK